MLERDKLAIGFDIGGTDIKYGIVTSQGDLREFNSTPTPKTSAQDIVSAISNLIAHKEEQYNTSLLIGIGIPGVYDTNLQEVIVTPNLISKHYPWHREIEKASGKKIVMDNDANMAALGEWWQGAGKDYRHLLLLTLGTGVGAGIILEGKVFSGTQGWAGEIGNTIVFPNGEVCNCGKKGCLEAYASAAAIARRYSNTQNSQYNTKQVFEAALKRDAAAQRVIDEGIEALAIGIYNYALIFNPQAVILGGGMIKSAGQFLVPLIDKVVSMLRVYPGKSDLIIKPAEMENKAGVLGAARAAFDMKSI